MSKEQSATYDENEKFTAWWNTQGIVSDSMRWTAWNAWLARSSVPSERGTLCGSRVCKTECAHPEDCMQQSEPTPATDAVSAAMYEHFKTRAMTVNDIEGFLAHARQLERKARVMQRVLERIPSAIQENREAEHLRMQIGYIVTQLMLAGDKRSLPEIVEEAANATKGKL